MLELPRTGALDPNRTLIFFQSFLREAIKELKAYNGNPKRAEVIGLIYQLEIIDNVIQTVRDNT